MYAPQIVNYINTVLQNNLSGKQFQQGVYNGIAKQVVRNRDNQTFVVIFDNEGNDLTDFINDKYSISVYHRMTGLAFFPVETNQANSFGDGAKTKGLVMNMVMVVYGDRKRLKMTNEELSSLMYVYFPSEVPEDVRSQLTGMEVLNISPVATNNVSAQVMTTEGITVEAENILFAVSYQIKEQINTNCFGACDYSFNTDSLCFELCAPASGALQSIDTLTKDGVNSYQFDVLKGRVMAFVLLDNMPLIKPPSANAQISFDPTTGTLSITDLTFAITAGQSLTIGYK